MEDNFFDNLKNNGEVYYAEDKMLSLLYRGVL